MLYARPLLNLDEEAARAWLPPDGLNNLHGREVLCLASGGGQQSAVLTLRGAKVTVFDLSETQLDRDREAAAHLRDFVPFYGA